MRLCARSKKLSGTRRGGRKTLRNVGDQRLKVHVVTLTTRKPSAKRNHRAWNTSNSPSRCIGSVKGPNVPRSVSSQASIAASLPRIASGTCGISTPSSANARASRCRRRRTAPTSAGARSGAHRSNDGPRDAAVVRFAAVIDITPSRRSSRGSRRASARSSGRRRALARRRRRSMKYDDGMPWIGPPMRQASPTPPLRSMTIGNVMPNSCANDAHLAAFSCRSTATTTRPASLCASYARTISGISCRQGVHHDAQKFTSTGLPCRSLSRSVPPSGVCSRKSGAARPISVDGGRPGGVLVGGQRDDAGAVGGTAAAAARAARCSRGRRRSSRRAAAAARGCAARRSTRGGSAGALRRRRHHRCGSSLRGVMARRAA